MLVNGLAEQVLDSIMSTSGSEGSFSSAGSQSDAVQKEESVTLMVDVQDQANENAEVIRTHVYKTMLTF